MFAPSRIHDLKRLLCCWALVIGAAGCKVGPNYRTPAVPVKISWSQQDHPRLQGEPLNYQAWWTHFGDPILDSLITRSISENLTLREAGKRVLEARARRDFTRGNLWPQSQTLDGTYSRQRISSNTANFFAVPGIFEPNLTPQQWSAGMSATWELDFWGRYRRAIEAADATLDATIAAYDDAAVLLLSEVAQAYVEMRTAENRLNLARSNFQIQTKTLELAQQKREAGLSSAVDVAQAELNYGQTAALLPLLEVERVQANNRLCLLLGLNPVDLRSELGYTGIIPMPMLDVALGVPADLVRRRPDVRQAERELAAQSARIGVAKADFYPQLSLTGSVGVAAQDLDRLFQSSSQVGLIAPQASWKLFNYGRLRANVEAEKAAFERLCYAYRNAVLSALREAEDAQVAFTHGYDRVQFLQIAVEGAKTAVEKLEESYGAGTVDFGRVYVLQSQLLVQQDQLASTRGDIAKSLIALFRAMGGGWEFARQAMCTPVCQVTTTPVGQTVATP